MNLRFGNLARLRILLKYPVDIFKGKQVSKANRGERAPEFEPGEADTIADALKMSSEHFQRGAGEQSDVHGEATKSRTLIKAVTAQRASGDVVPTCL